MIAVVFVAISNRCGGSNLGQEVALQGRGNRCGSNKKTITIVVVVSSGISTRSNSLGLGGFLDRGWQMATGSSTVQ